MDTMQQELGERAALIGVNAVGYDTYNDSFTSSADIPWLQDVPEVQAWGMWGAEWRDVVVLDSQGRYFGLFSLNEHDLGWEDDYEALVGMLVEAAAR
jgi:hypothetical protein